MKRRTVLGLTASALASTVAIGTGAFNTARADRDISVDIVLDEDAYLSITPLGSGGRSSGGQSEGNKKVRFRFPGPDFDEHPLGETPGLGTDSIYEFTRDKSPDNPDGLAEIRNQGTKTVEVTDEQEPTNGPDVGIFDISAPQSGDGFRLLLRESPVTLEPGDSVRIGVQIDTYGVEIGEGEGPDGQYLETVQFVANAVSD